MKNGYIYNLALKFKRKYSKTIAFRLKKHSLVIEKILDKDEKVFYAFCGQKNDDQTLLFSSCVVALTNKRIIVGEKRLLWGYFITSITTQMFNDLKISTGMLFGKVEIDTAKENLFISNLDKRSLDEIETNINNIMIENRKHLVETVNKKD